MSEGVVYGEAKRVTEIIASIGAKSNNFKVSFARCFCFVGPYLPLNANYAIGNFIGNFINNQDILVEGDGSPIRSYLYSSDLVIWLLTILIKGRNGVPYNVGGDRALTIAQLANIVAGFSNSNLNVVVKKPPLGLVNRPYLPDLSRGFEELGLKIHTGLEDSISKTIAWHRAEGKA
jgi:dTDP-glucose 4,6-dehydratase